jgi:hypothetical protein
VKHERFTTAGADDLHIRSLLGPVSQTDLSSTLRVPRECSAVVTAAWRSSALEPQALRCSDDESQLLYRPIHAGTGFRSAAQPIAARSQPSGLLQFDSPAASANARLRGGMPGVPPKPAFYRPPAHAG